MQPIQIDLRKALAPALGAGRGLPDAAIEAELARLADAGPWLEAERAAGRADWFDLPADEAPAEAVRAWLAAAPAADDVILVGIGGSALTARVVEAVRPSHAVGPRLHVIDTVDPAVVERVMSVVDPGSALLLSISKSGGTLETTSVLLVLEAWLREALGAAAPARVAVITGPDQNPLRVHAMTHGYALLDVPPGVGGRYSALTPVGLAPAAAVGIDPRRLLRGAATVRAAWLESGGVAHPALALAAVHAAAERAGRGVAVLMPYGAALEPLAPWWAQLVGESLGKPGPDGPVGVTPVAARGPTDQHSLLQLLVEGPDDKLVVVVHAADAPAGPVVPAAGADVCYAAGRGLGEILAAERRGTVESLVAAGRPVVEVSLAGADAEATGAFLFTYELAVVLWARLLGVDPQGQPGVEAGKQAARRILDAGT